MGELREFNDYDRSIIESFQDEMVERMGDNDLGIDVSELGDKEMQTFGFLRKLDDGMITMDVFEGVISEYLRKAKEDENAMHYADWLRGQAIQSLKEKQ